MQLINKYNEEVWFLSCVIGIYIKYTWVVHLKDKKGITIFNTFQKNINKSTRKQIKRGLIKVENFIIKQWNHSYKATI